MYALPLDTESLRHFYGGAILWLMVYHLPGLSATIFSAPPAVDRPRYCAMAHYNSYFWDSPCGICPFFELSPLSFSLSCFVFAQGGGFDTMSLPLPTPFVPLPQWPIDFGFGTPLLIRLHESLWTFVFSPSHSPPAFARFATPGPNFFPSFRVPRLAGIDARRVGLCFPFFFFHCWCCAVNVQTQHLFFPAAFGLQLSYLLFVFLAAAQSARISLQCSFF